MPLPFRTQLLKWVGNKQRFAHEIIRYFPDTYHTYHEPFLGSGAVLGTLAPARAVAGDALAPLIEIWQTLRDDPATLHQWYAERWQPYAEGDKIAAYEAVKTSYNAQPNGADLLFLARACYGGVVRFRQSDGAMSTPCGVHQAISPESFRQRVALWHPRVQGTQFLHSDFAAVMQQAQSGDLIYCDPPYHDSQTILYGAQGFSLAHLFAVVADCKARGVYVALSHDGLKKSGRKNVLSAIPDGLFEREVLVAGGRSMLRRFQMAGQQLTAEEVADRLLLTY